MDTADGARPVDCPNSPRAKQAEVVDRLRAACLIAVRHDPIERTVAYSAAEYETVRSAVALFVTCCRTENLSPERALVQLKRAVNDSLRTVGREPHEAVLRQIILEAFLRSYYDDTPRCDDVPQPSTK